MQTHFMFSRAEENYIKAIHKLSEKERKVATNSIAAELQTKASSVTDMLKKLSEKSLINYKKYQGVTLSEKGRSVAVKVIRKHRLWEVFLVDKLKFSWDEVHDIAEQLEHIVSPQLVDKLDAFLEFPKFDPHGDPIPDKDGVFPDMQRKILSEVEVGSEWILTSVTQDSAEFLKLIDKMNLKLGLHLKVVERFDFDHSLNLEINNKDQIYLSVEVAKNLLVSKV
ncbi:MAG: DtxR family Mn-dependent transcriptional regulator [Flavobacteriales bacterium]